MTDETTIPDEHAIYNSPAVLCRISLTREEIRIDSATVDHGGVRALLVFRNEEDAEEWRREALSDEEGLKPLPAEDVVLRDLLAMHQCTHVVTPISWLGDDSVDLYDAEDFMRLVESAVPA